MQVHVAGELVATTITYKLMVKERPLLSECVSRLEKIVCHSFQHLDSLMVLFRHAPESELALIRCLRLSGECEERAVGL